MIAQPNLFAGMTNYVGRVGQRITCELRLIRKIENLEAFNRFVYLFIDSGGNSLVWKTESDKALAEGDEVEVTFTVKRHGHYKGRKQTVIERLKFSAA